MIQIKEFDARTDQQARSYIATIRQDGECFATFRTTETNENGRLYRAVSIDLAHVEALADACSEDEIETYAASFAAPGDELIGVN